MSRARTGHEVVQAGVNEAPPRFDAAVVADPFREPGDPIPSTDGRLWLDVVFGDAGVCAARDNARVLHVWDEEALFAAVFRAQRR
jgi:hypothetical protein